VETLKRIRPGARPVTLDEWFRKNFHPGIMGFLQDELGFTPEEIEEEYRIWRGFTTGRTPDFFPGMLEALAAFRAEGGIVTVVSHSDADLIERDYRAASEKAGVPAFVPDRIFGWTMDENRRKPHPYPALRIIEEFGLDPADVLVVDDLRPGIEMAKAVGAGTAAAGWGHRIDEIRDYMLEACDHFFPTVEEFRAFVVPR
jgi:phosphoglycolate phosphatase/pyrophosphatase PpaX